jgi:hypothetical protein
MRFRARALPTARRDINRRQLMTTDLFRPVGLRELSLMWDSGMRHFPPRLPHQPIFYPVTSIEYARQIARDWNAQDEKSGFSGFVTSFRVDSAYISRFERHTVGSAAHVEYWIPANELKSFNEAIVGTIRLEEAYFGKTFAGYVPENFLLKEKTARGQFISLFQHWEYSSFDVTCEISANRKAVFLNWMFWNQHDFSDSGIDHEKQTSLLRNLEHCWELNHIEIPLPKSR